MLASKEPLRVNYSQPQLLFQIGTNRGQPGLDLASGDSVAAKLMARLDMLQGQQVRAKGLDLRVVARHGDCDGPRLRASALLA